MASVRPRPRRTWPERLLVALGVFTSAAMAVGVYALNLAQDKASEVQRIAIGSEVLADPVTTAEPRNILVVGIDSAAGLDPNDPRAVERPDSILTDTMMVVRIDPASRSASILSIPRDLVVTIAGTEQKANAAVSMGGGPDAGGVPLLIEAIDENFGIPINNYVQVDFSAFLDIVDAIDGVPFHFPNPVRDLKVGLQLNNPGCNVVGPDDALAYVRSRRLEELVDGVWVSDGIAPDLQRIQRQQAFVVAMVERAIAKGARNPITLNNLIDAAIDDVVLDSRLSPADLLELGDQFREFRTENLQTFTFNGLFDVDLRGAAALGLTDTPENRAVLVLFGAVPSVATDSDGVAEPSTDTSTGNDAGPTEARGNDAGPELDAVVDTAPAFTDTSADPDPTAEPTPPEPRCS